MTPLIHCVMVTRHDRIPLVDASIRSLGLQTYRNRKLIVVSDDFTPPLVQALVKSAKDHGVALEIWPRPMGQTLGELRNTVLERSDFQPAPLDFVCQWDDDDQGHPERLERQFKALTSRHHAASFLTSQLYWLAPQRELHVVDWQRLGNKIRRCIPGTVLHRANVVLKYPALSQGEDSHFRDQFDPATTGMVSNQPWLYLRVFHGSNTWSEDRFRRNVHLWAPKKRVLHSMIETLREECRLFAFGKGPIKIMHRDEVVVQCTN